MESSELKKKPNQKQPEQNPFITKPTSPYKISTTKNRQPDALATQEVEQLVRNRAIDLLRTGNLTRLRQTQLSTGFGFGSASAKEHHTQPSFDLRGGQKVRTHIYKNDF